MLSLLEKIKDFAKEDKDILAVFLFGSLVRKELSRLSDIDICLVLEPAQYSELALSEKKLKFLELFPHIDVKIFQQLPLYIKKRILKEGKIILCKDEEKMYNLAFSVITEYSDFEHIFRYYLKETEDAR